MSVREGGRHGPMDGTAKVLSPRGPKFAISICAAAKSERSRFAQHRASTHVLQLTVLVTLGGVECHR
jgi:hypothetical protein